MQSSFKNEGRQTMKKDRMIKENEKTTAVLGIYQPKYEMVMTNSSKKLLTIAPICDPVAKKRMQ